MAKNLVIVESPAKVKTIKKFLGSNYEVMASNGHVRDLPKSTMGIDVEHDFEPKYITIRGKGDLLASLRKEVKKADRVYLATDPDREGEAISWHLSAALRLEDKEVHRITFNEITKKAVKESIQQPRDINMDLVNAQQTRRILDRMVGYRISPLLWKKVKRGLSAGRVQSVALRIICDREAEIAAFIPEEYWTLNALLQVEGEKKPLEAKFYGTLQEKLTIGSEQELQEILDHLEGEPFKVQEIKHKERTKKAPLPFTTSTLQQEAANRLNFSTQKTMRLAQQLYEGVDIKGEGTIGIITYLRTDSTRISEEADATARAYIAERYGADFVAQAEIKEKKNQKIQDAHEAIRPTNITLTPEKVKESLSREQYRLYQLIWKRFTASRMAEARYQQIQLKLSCGAYCFTSSASRVAFEGFQAVYSDEEKPENNPAVKKVTEDSVLQLIDLESKQHFTQPPAHFTEASLVKTLEEQGIGRPSTYAPTITLIQSRHYVVKENKNLYVTELGQVVNDIMVQEFPSIVNVTFSANLESLLDMVGEGAVEWKGLIRNFYPDLDAAVQKAERELESVTIQDEVSDEICEVCGRNMVVKYGPHGKFLACPGFPECRNTMPFYEKIGVPCPKCGKDVVIKMSRKGRRYYECIDNTNCDFMSWAKPSAKKCPNCGSYMIEKGNKLICASDTCGYVENKKTEEEEE